MTIAFEASGSALYRAYAPSRRPRLSRRTALALGVAAAVHALIGYGVWNAKFRPHYEPVQAEAIDAELVKPRPAPPPPPPRPPPPKHEVRRAPPRPSVHLVSPAPTLRPRPTPTLAAFAPPPLPIAPAPPVPAPPAPPVLVAAPPPPTPKPPEPIHVITDPDWLRTPNGDDLARYYPDRAQRNGVEGKATINCAVNTGGSLVDCHVAAESPADQGFGGAAMKMAGAFRMRPETRDGVPVAGARISIPIRFRLPDA